MSASCEKARTRALPAPAGGARDSTQELCPPSRRRTLPGPLGDLEARLRLREGSRRALWHERRVTDEETGLTVTKPLTTKRLKRCGCAIGQAQLKPARTGHANHVRAVV